MTVRITSGTGAVKTKAQVTTLLGTPVVQEAKYTVDQDYFIDFRLEGQTTFEGGRKLLWKAGQVITQTELDAAFPTSTFVSITPASGVQAGGTAVTIKGTSFSGATAVAIGGVACTSFAVVNDTTITCVTGAHAAGAVNVVVTDDSGTVTGTSAYTYV